MTIFGLAEKEPGPDLASTKPRFWRRQFAGAVTKPQIIFDSVFGILGPILCFAFDPVVFRGGFAGPPLFPEYQIYVYLFSGLQMVLLALWLLSGTGVRLWNGTIGGALICGGVFCLAIGCVLLPFSLLGLMLGIGVFGFTPFLTAIVYLRNGFRACQSQAKDISVASRAAALVLGGAFVLSAPAALGGIIHSAVEKSVNEIIHGDSEHAAFAAHRLMPLKYFAGAELDKLVQAYLAESNPARKKHLKSCYQEITGEDIEDRVRILQD